VYNGNFEYLFEKNPYKPISTNEFVEIDNVVDEPVLDSITNTINNNNVINNNTVAIAIENDVDRMRSPYISRFIYLFIFFCFKVFFFLFLIIINQPTTVIF
jgi:hypothetical protein